MHFGRWELEIARALVTSADSVIGLDLTLDIQPFGMLFRIPRISL